MRRRILVERLTIIWVWAVGIIVIFLAMALLVALSLRASPIMQHYPLTALLLGTEWQPSKGLFGFYPFLIGTVWVTMIAMMLAVPISLLVAIYLAEYAPTRVRQAIKPIIDLMASVPSVVYGVFGVIVVVPFVGKLANFVQQYLSFLASQSPPTGYSVLAASIVLALMVSPTIVSVAEEVLRSVPISLREASLALSATAWETTWFVTLRATRTGLFGAVLLGFARAIGETMAVLMVVGNVPQVPRSLFDPAYPLPALIANNYGEMMSIQFYDAALMMAALILFVTTIATNLSAQLIIRLTQRRWGE